MTHGMIVAAVAIIGIGLTLAPADTSARPGGLAAGAPRAFHGGFRPAGVRPVRPLVHVPRAATPSFLGVSGRVGFARRPLALADHHRRVHGFGLGGPYVYGTFYPLEAASQAVVVNNQQIVYGQPAAAYPPAPTIVERVKVIVYRPAGCDSQTQTVPSKDGDQQITILRC
jgi:hypothetical protein